MDLHFESIDTFQLIKLKLESHEKASSSLYSWCFALLLNCRQSSCFRKKT
ncbi:hypothetical protein pah_c009o029 [Parachlamydia acanthamoebae str. Hall's coccus]|nr:hypothetical protein pah_c009o029 [Parachlamydia acanthamoebae str. Hall's coccus]